jgi:ribosomal protein L11 methyltransferase
VAWLLIKFSVTRRCTDAIADALTAGGALSVTVEAATDEERLQAVYEQTALWSKNRVTGLFPEDCDPAAVLDAVREVAAIDTLPPYQLDRLADSDWDRVWMANYRPQQITSRLWITPSWCDPPDPTAVNIVVDPGLAFGTGTHPTTRLCLGWLAAQSLQGRVVVDYGCGSGILAITALKLGATRAIGVDVDPQALAASRENASRNGVADRFHTCVAEDLAAKDRAHVLVANILSETLIALAPKVIAHTAASARLGLSGILVQQAADVRAAYAPYVALEAETCDGWVLLAGRRSR